jgi:hypothetical protein
VRLELVCISELGFQSLFTNLWKWFNCLSCKQNKQGYCWMPVTAKRVRIDPWLVRSAVILILFASSKTKGCIEIDVSWNVLVWCESLYILYLQIEVLCYFTVVDKSFGFYFSLLAFLKRKSRHFKISGVSRCGCLYIPHFNFRIHWLLPQNVMSTLCHWYKYILNSELSAVHMRLFWKW